MVLNYLITFKANLIVINLCTFQLNKKDGKMNPSGFYVACEAGAKAPCDEQARSTTKRKAGARGSDGDVCSKHYGVARSEQSERRYANVKGARNGEISC